MRRVGVRSGQPGQRQNDDQWSYQCYDAATHPRRVSTDPIRAFRRIAGDSTPLAARAQHRSDPLADGAQDVRLPKLVIPVQRDEGADDGGADRAPGTRTVADQDVTSCEPLVEIQWWCR